MTLAPGDWLCPTSDGTNWPAQTGHYNTFPGPLFLSGTLTPSAFQGNVNDYNPAGLARPWRCASAAVPSDRTITGLAGGSDGRIITITNIGATNSLVLANESGSSTAANRFLIPANTTLPVNTSLAFRYDGTSSRWRPWSRALSDTGITAGAYTCANVTSGQMAGSRPRERRVQRRDRHRLRLCADRLGRRGRSQQGGHHDRDDGDDGYRDQGPVADAVGRLDRTSQQGGLRDGMQRRHQPGDRHLQRQRHRGDQPNPDPRGLRRQLAVGRRPLCLVTTGGANWTGGTGTAASQWI